MYLERATTAVDIGVLYGIGAILGTGFCIGSYRLANKVNALINSHIPALKGPLNAGIVIASSSMIAFPLSQFISAKTERMLPDVLQNYSGMVATALGALTIFLATMGLTPNVSNFISNYSVGYVEASFYGLAGAVTFAMKGVYQTNLDEEELGHVTIFAETMANSVVAGIASIAVNSLGLLFLRTAQFIFKKAPEMIWETLPIGGVAGISTFLGMPLFAKAVDLITENENTKIFGRMIFVAALVFSATAFLTPKLLTTLSPYKLKSLSRFKYKLLGGGAALSAALFDYKNANRIRNQEDQNKYEDYAYLTLYALATGVVTSVATTLLLNANTILERAPILKGTLSVSAIGGGLSALYKLTESDGYPGIVETARLAIVFFLTAGLAPKAAKYLFNYDISYLKAAGLTVAGGLGLGLELSIRDYFSGKRKNGKRGEF